MKTISPILITGANRSGSSIIARCFEMCGGSFGVTDNMFENINIKALHNLAISISAQEPFMPTNEKVNKNVKNWNGNIFSIMQNENINFDKFVVKGAYIAQLHSIWSKAFPDSKYIIVRRRTGDIVQSCIKTAYMGRFKEKKNRDAIHVKTEEQGWLWWVEQYNKKFVEITNNANHRIIWAERMADYDFEQMKEAIAWCGLQWNADIEEIIPTMLRKGQ